ncbi:MAG: type II toxin-antitoxin system RelE/ParE family toxin [bacterium]|nr:type II toxin-antitoxin system RelE/ParE family toxin [bacterium]
MSCKIWPVPLFENEIKRLARKYRQIYRDYEELLDMLENNPLAGEALGKNLYKVRVPSSDMKRGKRGGFRVIYYLLGAKDTIYLLTIYAKAKQEGIKNAKIKKILADYGLE